MTTILTPLIIGTKPTGQIVAAVLFAVVYGAIRLVDRAFGRHLQNGYWRAANWIRRRSRRIIPLFFALLTLTFIIGRAYLWAAIVGIWYGAVFVKAHALDWLERRKMRSLAADPEALALPWHIEETADNTEGRHWVDVLEIDAGLPIGLYGRPGSGKTETIKHLLYQLTLQDPDEPFKPVVVLDLKDDFKEALSAWGVPYTTISPSAANTDVRWNIFEEPRPGHNEQELEELARSMIPSATMGSDNDDFFKTGSRQVFEGVLKHVHRQAIEQDEYPTNETLIEFFQQVELPECYEALGEYDDMAAARTVLDPDAEGQSVGVYSTLQTKVKDIFTMQFQSAGEFSIRRYMENPRDYGVLLIDVPAEASDSVKPAYRVMLDWAIRLGEMSDRQVNYIFDEFAQIPHMRRVEKLLNMGRGEGAIPVLALQSKKQLDYNYGSDQADSIAGGIGTNVFLGLTDPESVDFAQRVIGKHGAEHERPKLNFEGETVGVETDERPEKPVYSGQITSWSKGEGVVVRPEEGYILGRNRLISQEFVDLWREGMGLPLDGDRGDGPPPEPQPPADPDDGDSGVPAAADGGSRQETGDSND